MELTDIHYYVLLASVFVTCGIVLELYSAITFIWTYFRKQRAKISEKSYQMLNLKGKIAISIGVLIQGIGFILNNQYGIYYGYIWITGGLITIYDTSETFPPTTLYGLILGIVIIMIINYDVIVRYLKWKHKIKKKS